MRAPPSADGPADIDERHRTGSSGARNAAFFLRMVSAETIACRSPAKRALVPAFSFTVGVQQPEAPPRGAGFTTSASVVVARGPHSVSAARGTNVRLP